MTYGAPPLAMSADPVAIDWNAFFQLYRPMALRFARGLVGSEAAAEDVLQEAAAGLYERVSDGRLQLGSHEHARNYFFRAVRNRAASSLRRVDRAQGEGEGLPEHVAQTAGPLELAAEAEAGSLRVDLEGDLEAALGSLGREEQAVLRLRFGEGLGFREISERTGTSISTLHSRVGAGLAKIRMRIGKRWGDAY